MCMMDEADFRTLVRSTSAVSVVRRVCEHCHEVFPPFCCQMPDAYDAVTDVFRQFVDSTSPEFLAYSPCSSFVSGFWAKRIVEVATKFGRFLPLLEVEQKNSTILLLMHTLFKPLNK